MTTFNINQIVRGKVAGVFVILGFRRVNRVEMAVLKSVNPTNLGQVLPGELWLEVDSLKEY